MRTVLDDGVDVGAILDDHVHREGGGRAARADPRAAAGRWARSTRRARPRARSSRRSTASARGCCARTRWRPARPGVRGARSARRRAADGRARSTTRCEAVAERVPELASCSPATASGPLRAAVLAALRRAALARRDRPGAAAAAGAALSLDRCAAALLSCAAAVARAELGAVAEPEREVVQALERLARRLRRSWAPAASRRGPGTSTAASSPAATARRCRPTRACAYAEALAAFRARLRARVVGRRGGRRSTSCCARSASATRSCKRARVGARLRGPRAADARPAASDARLRARYRERFEQIMVDELQDTNAVQLALIESIADGNLFTVGDAQQSIYGFRHADVELFERRGERRSRRLGARLTLRINFRSRPEILRGCEPGVRASALGERFRPLEAGRRPTSVPCGRAARRAADRRQGLRLGGRGDRGAVAGRRGARAGGAGGVARGGGVARRATSCC